MTDALLTAFECSLDVPYAQAIERVTAALKDEGFGVLTKIDVKATLREKINVDFREHTILGACNPTLAHRALSTTLDVGLLLPCNVTVYATDDQHSVVSIIDPISMMAVMGNPALAAVADEARVRLERVHAALAA